MIDIYGNNSCFKDAKSLIVSLRETLDGVEPAESRILAAFTDLDLKQLAPLYGNDVQVKNISFVAMTLEALRGVVKSTLHFPFQFFLKSKNKNWRLFFSRDAFSWES